MRYPLLVLSFWSALVAWGAPTAFAQGAATSPAAAPRSVEPISPAARRATVDRALGWLLAETETDAFQKGGAANAQAKRAVVRLLLAYLVLVNPIEDEARRERILRRAERVSGSAGMGFPCWIEGFRGLYALERAVREGRATPALRRSAAFFMSAQNREGGWSHSQGSLVSFYPSTLICTSNLALLALGGARRFDLAVAKTPDFDDVVEEAWALYERVQSPNGSFPYGGASYRKGFQSGRTAASLLAFAALGRADTAVAKNAARYVAKNVAHVPYGHASPALHIGLGGLAVRTLGERAWATWVADVLTDLAATQDPAGFFPDFVPGSPDSLSIMANQSINRAYQTALYAVALSADRSALAADLANGAFADVARAPGDGPTLAAPAGGRRAAVAVGTIDGLAAHGRTVAALRPDDRVCVFDGATGRSIATVAVTSIGGRTRSIALRDDHLVVLHRPDRHESLGGRRTAARDDTTAGWVIESYAVSDGTRCWQWRLPAVQRYRLTDEAVVVLTPNGALFRRSLDGAGEPARDKSLPSVANAALAVVGERTFVGAGPKVASYRAGAIQWERRLRGPRGVSAPPIGTLAAADGILYVGAADGRVEARDWATGAVRWRIGAGSYPTALVRSPSDPGTIVVARDDGQLDAIAAGRSLWTRQLTGGAEVVEGIEVRRRPLDLRVAGSGVWVASSPRRRLMRIDPANGRIERSIECAGPWAVGEGFVAVVEGERLVFFDAK